MMLGILSSSHNSQRRGLKQSTTTQQGLLVVVDWMKCFCNRSTRRKSSPSRVARVAHIVKVFIHRSDGIVCLSLVFLSSKGQIPKQLSSRCFFHWISGGKISQKQRSMKIAADVALSFTITLILFLMFWHEKMIQKKFATSSWERLLLSQRKTSSLP